MTNEASSQQALNEAPFDLAIVGGGIYGAALLYEASLRNLRVVLLEKDDFCAATSANSLKTIHGGIRYLQNFNFSRTLESDREKKILHRIAPNLIVPLDCCVPSDGSLTKNAISFWGAATLFNVLTGLLAPKESALDDDLGPVKPFANARMFRSSRLLHDDLIRASKCPEKKAYLAWQDAQVANSELLAMCFIRAACNLGAVALNYTAAHSLEDFDKEIKTINLRSFTGEHSVIQAKYLVDCSGSGDFLASQVEENEAPQIEYVKAVNLVFNSEFSRYAFASESRETKLDKGGMLFFSPWKSMTLAGTWYFDLGSSEQADMFDVDTLNSCLRDINTALSAVGADVSIEELNSMLVDVQIGFLPSRADEPHPETSLLEKLTIAEFGIGCFRMQGTKYTTARADAVKMINRLADQEPSIPPSNSHLTPLRGAQILDQQSMAELVQGNKFEEGKEKILVELSTRYGDLLPQMLADSEKPIRDLAWVSDSGQITNLEIEYFASESHTKTLVDLLFRRINRNIYMRLSKEELEYSSQVMSTLKGWSESNTSNNVAQVRDLESKRDNLRTQIKS